MALRDALHNRLESFFHEQEAEEQANARASTGPKTARGKSHAKKNAFRHGLSASAFRGSAQLAEIEELANEIAGCGHSISRWKSKPELSPEQSAKESRRYLQTLKGLTPMSSSVRFGTVSRT